ncbi:MAG: lysophospholipid acyltransferase family protein [Planctomycetaceae bacterium]
MPPDFPNGVWRFFRLLATPIFLWYIRVRGTGTQHLPASGPALLVSNHQSYLDPLAIAFPASRPVSYVARSNLFSIPLLGWIFRRTYVIPIRRDGGAAGGIRAAAERLGEGFLVGVFPEGTRSPDGRLAPLKPGLLSILKRAPVTVIPVGVAGTRHSLGRGDFLVKPAAVRVVFGSPISPAQVQQLLNTPCEESALLHKIADDMANCLSLAENWLAARTLEPPASEAPPAQDSSTP